MEKKTITNTEGEKKQQQIEGNLVVSYALNE